MKMFLILGCALLTGVGVAPETTPPLKQSALTVAEYQKPGAPITLEYTWLQKPSLGSAGKLQIQLKRHGDVNLDVQMNAGSALQWVNKKQANFSVQKSSSGPIVREIDIVPVTEGRHYLHIFVESGEGTAKRSRTFAVPVQVGNVSEKALLHPHLKTLEDGSKIIELPAEER